MKSCWYRYQVQTALEFHQQKTRGADLVRVTGWGVEDPLVFIRARKGLGAGHQAGLRVTLDRPREMAGVSKGWKMAEPVCGKMGRRRGGHVRGYWKWLEKGMGGG